MNNFWKEFWAGFSGSSHSPPSQAASQPRQVRKRHTKKYSVLNMYVFPLVLIMTLCVVLGAHMIYTRSHILLGFVLFSIGAVSFVKGLRQPKASPRRVWLITAFGQKTETIVDSLTLTLNWLPIPIIGYVEIVMAQYDQDFKLQKPVKCKEDGYIEGTISVSLKPDEDDDEPGTPNGKTGGQKLQDFDDAGGTEDIKNIYKQVDDVLTAWIQQFAKYRSVEWMEENGVELGSFIVPYLMGKKDIAHIPPALRGQETVDALNGMLTSNIDDLSHLGICIMKLQINVSANEKVIEARNRIGVEKMNRVSELENGRTMGMKIAERTKLYRQGIKDEHGNVFVDPPEKQPTMKAINDILIEEDLEEDAKLTGVHSSQQGLTVANVNTTQGGNR